MVDPAHITDLPGAPAFPERVRCALADALSGRPHDFRPRTRHLDPAGAPRFTNRLALTTSPYLLQHAHNPVNWFPWGDEASALARELDRPLFLSIGYSTCHWCHVMEEESFEDPGVAELINAYFVPVKVDREERPDVDSVYMTAVQAISGHGGWPMTVVMTPDGKPFFAATYLPPRAGHRGARAGLAEVLSGLHGAWVEQRELLLGDAERVSHHVARLVAATLPGDVPGPDAITHAADRLLANVDPRFGGIGGAPKFPQPALYGLLLRVFRRTGQERYLEVVVKTLEAMARGGLYDQLGGGFHRYSTDARWLVPHFEKMLYDNAQLATLYLEAFQVTSHPLHARIARETLDYVARELTSPEGAFYSATDADSDGEEGTFFLWDDAELAEGLTDAELALTRAYYCVTTTGNFEGRNILTAARPVSEVAAALARRGTRLENPEQTLAAVRTKLYDLRARRTWPGLDDKVLASWNGLMISAFARAAFVLGEQRYLELACRAADTVLDRLWVDGRLYRTWAGGRATTPGFLDDYAFLEAGLLELFQASGALRYLQRALELQAVQDAVFADTERGGYYFTSTEHESLLAREKPSYDGAEPNGNSVAAENLLRLAELTDDLGFRTRAEALFAAFGDTLTEHGTGAARMLIALDFATDRPRQIVVVVPTDGDPEPLLARLRDTFLPAQVRVVAREGEPLTQLGSLVPWVAGKVALEGRPTAYVCEAGRCERPTTDPRAFAQQLAVVEPYRP